MDVPTLMFMTDVSVAEAERGLGALVQRAASAGERVTIINDDHEVAVLVGAEDLADLEEELALARYRARQAAGQSLGGTAHNEVRSRLGLPRR